MADVGGCNRKKRDEWNKADKEILFLPYPDAGISRQDSWRICEGPWRNLWSWQSEVSKGCLISQAATKEAKSRDSELGRHGLCCFLSRQLQGERT